MRQIRRLYRTVDALLIDLPGIESGSLRICPVRFDLRDTVHCAVEELRVLLEARTFRLRVPADPVAVHCDAQRVAHIVTSLLDNAVKYSPEPAPIDVTLVAAGGEAIVAVTDRGIGIPSHELDQVGTRFFRGSNAPSYIYRGLGVGLYLARAFAELCHGRLRIESAEGEGTRAELVLPLARNTR
jgi:signal transduction histidine kinase